MTRSPKNSKRGGSDDVTSPGKTTQTTTSRSDGGMPIEDALSYADDVEALIAKLEDPDANDVCLIALAVEVKRLRALNRSFGAAVGKMIVSLNRDRDLPDDVAHLVNVIRQELEKTLDEHSVGEAKP